MDASRRLQISVISIALIIAISVGIAIYFAQEHVNEHRLLLIRKLTNDRFSVSQGDWGWTNNQIYVEDYAIFVSVAKTNHITVVFINGNNAFFVASGTTYILR